MRHQSRRYTSPILAAGLFLLCFASGASAQGTRSDSGSSTPSATQNREASAADLHAMADSIRALQVQVATLVSQLNEMKAQQDKTLQETQKLRRELESASARQASDSLPAAQSYAAAPAIPLASERSVAARPASLPSLQSVAGQLTLEQRLDSLEESQQMLDEKLNSQEQTKVESGSKYRVRFSGIALFNLYGTSGLVDNQDFPQIALESNRFESDRSFGGSLRQSQLGFEVFGPDIAGAHTSANLRFDFGGGFPNTANGTTFGLVRLRTGTVRFDWQDTSVVGGQDTLFIAPLSPTSLANLATPALSYSGNLWAWTPQVRIEHRFHFNDNSTLTLQGGVLDSWSGDLPPTFYDRYPTWGEQSGQPAYAARVAWTQETLGQKWTVGAGGLYARQYWAFDRNLDSWAGTVDVLLPLGRFVELSGAFYRGRALGGYGAGVGQTVLYSGDFANPLTAVRGLNSMGGWTQFKFKPTTRFEVNAAFGQDNPFASDLRAAAFVPSQYGEPLSRNQSWFANFIYQTRSNVLFSAEFRRIKTSELDSEDYLANQFNLVLGYIF